MAERAASLGCDGLDVDHARGSRRCARRRAPVRERQGTPRHAGQLQRLDVDQGGRRTLRARGCARIVDQLAGVPATLRARGCRARRRAHSTAAERGSRARLLVGERWLSVDGVTRHAWGCRPNRTALKRLRPALPLPLVASASPSALRSRWSLRTDDPATIRRRAKARRVLVVAPRFAPPCPNSAPTPTPTPTPGARSGVLVAVVAIASVHRAGFSNGQERDQRECGQPQAVAIAAVGRSRCRRSSRALLIVGPRAEQPEAAKLKRARVNPETASARAGQAPTAGARFPCDLARCNASHPERLSHV